MIVTHYKEPWIVGKPFFDMLALQENIRFDDVGVILVNDGEENELPESCFGNYPYSVCQTSIPHGGVSKARNTGLDLSDADYVMFCDFDDCFATVFALYTIFCGMAENKYDLLRATFIEETMDSKGSIHLVNHDDDVVFVHGKIIRRKWLIDNGIRFNEKLTIHEDGFFNALTFIIAEPDRKEQIKTPLYVWKWNPNSVVRKGKSDDYVLDTYNHLMRQRIAVTEEFIKRGRSHDVMMTVIKTVMDSYYDFQQSTWRVQKNKSKRERAERWFCAYLKRYAKIYAQADVKQIANLARVARDRSFAKGTFLVESETMKDWLEHIMRDVRPIPLDEQDV